MALKFVLEFENVERVKCVVNFFFTDYDGNPITIYGGARPFVLGEFNSDEDLFKPIRPQQATIEILASASGVKLEDFLSILHKINAGSKDTELKLFAVIPTRSP